MKLLIVLAVLAATGTCRELPDEIHSVYQNINKTVAELIINSHELDIRMQNGLFNEVIRHNVKMQRFYREFSVENAIELCKQLGLECVNNPIKLEDQITVNKMCLHLDAYVYAELITFENFLTCNFRTVTHLLQLFERSVKFLKNLDEKLIEIINDDTTSETSLAITIMQIQSSVEIEKNLIHSNFEKVSNMIKNITKDPPNICNEYSGIFPDREWFQRNEVRSCMKNYHVISK